MNKYIEEKVREKREREYELQYIALPDDSKIHVTDLEDNSVSLEECKDWRMNSYAKDLFIPKLTDESLFEKIEFYLKNAKRYEYPATTYDEALVHVFVPELVKRLKEARGLENEIK